MPTNGETLSSVEELYISLLSTGCKAENVQDSRESENLFAIRIIHEVYDTYTHVWLEPDI